MWTDSFINAICDGNEIYDDIYKDTAVYLDVDDVVQSVGTECHVQSTSQVFDFTDLHNFAALKAHIDSSQKPCYGVMIGCGRSVGILVKANGLCILADSHIHINDNNGAMILVANSPGKLIAVYSQMLHEQSLTLSVGTLTWIHYASS